MADHPEVVKSLHNTSIASEHQLFMNSPGDQPPVAGVVQFEPVTVEHQPPQLKELPSVTSSLRSANRNDLAVLSSMPDYYQKLLSTNIALPQGASAFLNSSCTHAFTALQHTNDPVALSFQASKAAVEGFGLFAADYQKVKSTFLMYGIKIPGSAAYWGMQKVEPDKRIVLEASKHCQLIGLEAMTRQEEADIEKVTGQSVRQNRSNSIKYTLIIATLMDQSESRLSFNPRGLRAEGYNTYVPRSIGFRFSDSEVVVDSDDDTVGFDIDGEVNESDSGPLASLASVSTRDPNAENVGWRPPQSSNLPMDTVDFGSGFGTGGGARSRGFQSAGGHFSARSFTANLGDDVQTDGLFSARPFMANLDVQGGGFLPEPFPKAAGERAEFFSTGASGGCPDLFGRVGGGAVGELSTGGNAQFGSKGQPEPEIVEKGSIKKEQAVTSVHEGSGHLEKLSPQLRKALAFKSDATIKKLSDQLVPTAYQNKRSVEAVQNLCPESLVPQMIAFLDVDILRTPCPVSSKEPPVGLLLEAAVQQMHILDG